MGPGVKSASAALGDVAELLGRHRRARLAAPPGAAARCHAPWTCIR